MEQNSDYFHWKKTAFLFLISQNISLFGSSVVAFAIIWHITLTTSSGFWVMLSTLSSVAPQVLVSLFGGVWADRYNRKILIMAADGFIALATLLLAVAFLLGYQRLELILLVSVVRSLGAGIQMPAVSAIFPQIVPPEQLTKVQGINQTMGAISLLVSPAVGGILLGSTGIVAAFFVDVVTAFMAIIVMSAITVRRREKDTVSQPIFTELKAGVTYTFNHAKLRHIVICYLFYFFLITPAAVLSPLMVERSFGSEVWRLTVSEIVWTGGSLIGGIYVSLKGDFRNKVRTIAYCLVSFGILFSLLGMTQDFIMFLLLMGMAGLFAPVIATAQTVYIQEITEEHVLGRVFSIVQIISVSAVPVGILIFGPLADVISVEQILLATGVLLVLTGILFGLLPAKGDA